MSSTQTLFNILYIEDDKLTREITAHLLKKMCTKLILSEDGLDGFIKFKSHNIDLIITDLSMPKINGVEFIKMIRDIDNDVPIIIISVDTNGELLCNSINYGIQGYIHKPINHKILQTHIENIKKEKQNKNLIKEYQSITDSSAIISKLNKEGIITYVNETFCNISGFTKQELIGQPHQLINTEESNSFAITKLWTGVLKHKNKSGELYYLKTTIQPLINDEGEIEQYITLAIPVTDIIHHEEQLNDYLKQHNESVILLVKIEEFKYLNRSFTKKITKSLQNIFTKELLNHMPPQCGFNKVYLLNNGEFAFVKKHDEFIDQNEMIKVLKTFQENVNKANIQIGIVNYTLSILCSLAYGKDALDNAKIGLNKILKTKEEFIVATNFLEEVTKDSNEKLNKFKMLREAIESYNIVSHFQPIVCNQTKKIVKYESLVRLIDTDNNTISPYHFLEIAKEGKYYHTITSIVLRNSFRALFNSDIEISINLSALDMEDQRTRDEFFLLLEKYKTEAYRITVEVIEDEKIKNERNTQKFLQEIRTYGVKIALDDFGTGESNFSRIQAYQPDYIKIDGSLIRNIEHDKFTQDLVETIVYFAKKRNIQTIAEFVENEEIYLILKELGVDYSQGHYFAKAGVLKEFITSAVL